MAAAPNGHRTPPVFHAGGVAIWVGSRTAVTPPERRRVRSGRSADA